jgi:hypothetical protein
MSEKQAGSERRNINTTGGAYIEGNVDAGGGDVVGRDQVKIGQVIGNIFFGNVDAERTRRNQENRKAMIQRVRHAWIDGVLKQSLYQIARIDLGLEEQPDAVARPWDVIVQEQGRPPRDLPPGTRMGRIFDDLGGALLILGAPGTGKTTLLLELADELLDRAERDAGHRMPVVFNLSSWAVKRKPLGEWLVDELNQRYDVPRKIGQDWVDADAILPLLDGLDEVAQEHREACVEAINKHRQEHGLVPMTVCSRETEYVALEEVLRLSGAVTIRALDRAAVDGYLARAGEALAGMRDALAGDETLYEVLETPLMLSVAALAYQGATIEDLAGGGTVEERRSRLFAAYVDRAFLRRGTEPEYTRAQCERWLAWLSKAMAMHEQTVFYLERVQPDWLPTQTQKWTVRWGVAIALGLWCGLALGLVSGMYGGLFRGLGGGLVGGLSGGLFGYGSEITPAETLRWSWASVRRGWRSVLVCALFVGLFGALGGGLYAGLSSGLFGALGGGLGGMLVFGLVFGLTRGELTDRVRPNQGIRRSARSGLVVGLIVGLLGVLGVGLVFGMVAAPQYGLITGLIVGLFGGLVLGLLTGLIFGLDYGWRACLQHLVLRWVLWRRDLAPWRYVQFLDYAAERILLRKVGGGYIFIHRLLMEHFAARLEEAG